MNSQQVVFRHVCRARPSEPLSCLRLSSIRSFHTTRPQDAINEARTTARAPKPSGARDIGLSTQEKLKNAQRRAQEKLKAERQDMQANLTQGGLASSSLFADDSAPATVPDRAGKSAVVPYDERSAANMAHALNPRPSARSRWQRRMVIRHIQHGGRLNKEMKIARTERSHLSRSHFFKTSMKKLAPLARQIAGKSLDEAILQMRFSRKKAAKDIRDHLLQARHEAITSRGMGLKENRTEAESKSLVSDPAHSKPLPHQTPIKTKKAGHAPDPTDIYIAEAWTNRGPYGREPDYRARGRVYIMRPPNTGISVMLKEEKTRTRQKAEKEAKALRKRMSKKLWVQLPDRKVTTQRQHVLW